MKTKDSGIEWIGEIPEDWTIKPLKQVVTCLESGGTPESNNEQYYTDDGVAWVIISDMKKEIIFDTQKKLTEEGLKSKKLKIFPPHTLLYAMYASVGKVAELAIPAAVNQAILAISVDPCLASERFLKFCLKAFENYVIAESNGNTQFNLNASKVANFYFSFPTLQAQQCIVDYLDKKCAVVDRLMENQRLQIEKLKEYKQSVITEAVTKGLDKSVPLKSSGVEWIGDIAESHKIVRLKFLLSQNMAYGANESGGKNFIDSVRYIRITDITADGSLKDGDDNQYISKEKAKGYILSDKDILFARSGGTVGKTFLYRKFYGECAYAGYLIQAKCNANKLLPEYLMYYTQSSLYSLWKNMIFIQATIQNIGANKYSNLEIVDMDIEEQKSIVDYLDTKCAEIDELISIKQQKIEKLTEYKKSLIYEYVTGKKQVG